MFPFICEPLKVTRKCNLYFSKIKPISTPNGEVNDNWIIISIQPKESIHNEINKKFGLDDAKSRKIQLDGGIRIEGDETIDFMKL